MGSYKCNCNAGWMGSNCSQDINECSYLACGNNATCINSNGSYFCNCPNGWKGKNCTEDINECSTISPCANNATCRNTDGAFICNCTSGWTGSNCTEEMCKSPVLADTMTGFKERGTKRNISNDFYLHDESIEIVCREGYIQQGTLTCKHGTWIGNSTCQLEERACNEQPPTIPNAYITPVVLQEYKHGTVLQYKCRQAFDQSGRNSYVTCLDGQWIRDLANMIRCIPGNCTQINSREINNGRVKNISGIVGTYAEFECDDGYELDGSAKILCMPDRKWHPEIPTCKPGHCTQFYSGKIDNGRVKIISGMDGTYADFECDDGYELDGNAQILCLTDMKWHPDIPTCKPISCPEPAQLINGKLTEEVYDGVRNTFQSTIRYECNKGYKMVGSQLRRCQSDRTWSGYDTKCEIILCAKPSSPENGRVYLTDNSEKFGSQIEYICDENYSLNPKTSQFAICTEYGNWSKPKPICRDNKLDDVLFVGDGRCMDICRININVNDSCAYIELPAYDYPNDIDYDPVDDTLYWINKQNGLVTANLSGNSLNTISVISKAGRADGRINGIAVDSKSRLLFYTSFLDKYKRIKNGLVGFIAVVGLNDFLHKPIISGLYDPRSIAVDTTHGAIYWTDASSPAKIEKSNYDGTNRQELVNSGLISPYEIDVDVNAGIIYWCGTRTIERVNVDGSNRSIIYRLPDERYSCIIALYQSYLYFTQQRGNPLMRIGTDGRGLVSIYSTKGMKISAIHVNIRSLLGINGCSNRNGGCSNFRFPLPGGNKICACPNLMTLQPDGQTCRQDALPEILFISYYNSYGFVTGEDIRENYTHFVIPLSHHALVIDIDYDRTTDNIYWVQANNQIYSSKIFGKKDTRSRSMNIDAEIYGIAADSISRLLFYTDGGNDVIAVISLQDFSQKTIISTGLVHPTDIIADPINGTIYWVDTGSGKIEKSNYDGSNRQVVVVSDPRSLFDLDVDFEAELLYWCEISNFRIERSNLDGSNRFTIYQEQGLFYGCRLVFYQSFIFFTRMRSSYDITRIGTDGTGLTTIAPFVHQYPLAIHVTINESLGKNGCSNKSDGCSHFCFPKPDGNYVCDYPDCMSLQPDFKTCQLDNLPDTFLLITVESYPHIYRMDITNYSYVRIPVHQARLHDQDISPYNIDYDPSTDLMFWTDRHPGHFFSTSIYGNNQTTLLHRKHMGIIGGIAMDVISRLLFYTSESTNIIGVICLKSGLHKMIIAEDIYRPQAIVTDSNNSSIYWSSYTKIEKSNYDGTSRQKIVDTGTNNYVDLALDINEGVIFWCHYRTRKIEVANVNGSNRHVLYEDQKSISKCSIALHESHLYYIDSDLRVLMRIGTDGSGRKFIGNSLPLSVSDLYIHNNSTRKSGVNGCSKDNGGCSHLCLPRPGGSKVCDCPDNMTLEQDGLTCGNYALPENFILLTNPSFNRIRIMDNNNYRYVTFEYEKKLRPGAVAFDPVNQEFYWIDQRFRRIMVSSANGNVKRTVKQLKRTAEPLGIALDVQSRLLFYMDYNNGIIAALSLDGSMHKTINGRLHFPRYIAIDPINGAIYWISKEMNYHKIEKSNYDGTHLQELIRIVFFNPTGLAIDSRAGFIYWSNWTQIERCNVDGTNRQLIYQDKSKTARIYGIALYQSNIYIIGYFRNLYLDLYTLMKIGRDGSNPVLFGPDAYGYDTYIVVHSNDSVPAGSNVCSNKNGGCSHFCFPSTAGRYVCACPDGQILRRDDSHTCRSIYFDVDLKRWKQSFPFWARYSRI